MKGKSIILAVIIPQVREGRQVSNMPKVKINVDPEKERVEMRKRMISAKAQLRGYGCRSDVSQALGKNLNWYTRRLNGGLSWGLDDLAALDKALKFTDAELAQIVRGR